MLPLHSCLLLLSFAVISTHCATNTPKKPSRGWRSWNLFGLNVNQTLMIEIMDAMVSRNRSVDGVPTSLFDLGYNDVGLDDAWQSINSGPNHKGYHDINGNPIVNTTRFPNMTEMNNYAHSLGLLSGWYGNNCYGNEQNSSIYHFIGDVAAFKAFKFDSYKLDSCGGQKDIALWANLLGNITGTLENCHNGPYFPEPSYKPTGTIWCPFDFYRTSVDAEVLYSALFGVNLPTVDTFARQNLSFPGCWAYPDMLEVGVSPGLHSKEVALTHTEARSHFGAWAITSSPLILGLDVRDSTVMDNVWDIISNKEALAVNEEYAGSSGLRIASSPVNQTFPFCGYLYADGCSIPSWELFSKPLLNGAAALLFINHGESNVNITINTNIVPGLQCSQCNVRDIWQHQDLGSKGPILTINDLASHDSVFYTLH